MHIDDQNVAFDVLAVVGLGVEIIPDEARGEDFVGTGLQVRALPAAPHEGGKHLARLGEIVFRMAAIPRHHAGEFVEAIARNGEIRHRPGEIEDHLAHYSFPPPI
ncbi:MAG: hypothetical protein AAB223_07090 [Pseudomonadota bacterium]|mgnify:CR=1 FL=1